MRRAGLAMLLLFLAVPAFGQPRTSESIEISIVNVDVVVTDKKGNRVTGLTAKDFEIRESGKVQPITNFTEYGSDAGEGMTGLERATAAETAPRPPRTIVLFVEWMRMPPFQSERMYDGLRAMLRKTLGPEDRAMIVTWSMKVDVRQPFTSDLEQLEAVLDVVQREHSRGYRLNDVEAEQAGAEQAQSNAAAQEFIDAVQASGMDISLDGMPPAQALEVAMRSRDAIRQKTRALEALMNSISGVEGRKILIMAVRQFGMFAGGAAFPDGNVPADRREELNTRQFREDLIRTANANNVALYPIYPPGLKWSGPPGNRVDVDHPGSRRAVQESLDVHAKERNELANEARALDEFAEETGGLAAWGAGDIVEMLPRIADDLESYYSLAYRVPATGNDSTRRIEVRSKNRDHQIRARTQFVEKSDETQMKDRLIANLYQGLESEVIPFEVELGDLRATGRKQWELPVKVRIPIAALTTLPEDEQEVGEFSVYVVAGGNVGVMSEVQRKSQPFRIPRSDLDQAKSSHFTYEVALMLDAKVDRLSIGVVDETAKEVGLQRIAIPQRPIAAAAKK